MQLVLSDEEAQFLNNGNAPFNIPFFPASALAVSISVIHGSATHLRSQLWTPTLQYYTAYTVEDLADCIQAMAKRVLNICAENTPEAIKEQEVRKLLGGKSGYELISFHINQCNYYLISAI